MITPKSTIDKQYRRAPLNGLIISAAEAPEILLSMLRLGKS
ncbi:hypothetical protein [Cutibacterium acnes]|nr:hypothetical protein [Cutibacterium acnes]